MAAHLNLALLVALAASASAWSTPALRPAALRRGARLAASPLLAADADDEIVWEFGDAAGTPDATTATAIEGEERELTEKEKEIARLRAAEKFMMKDTGDAVCRTCGYKYGWENGVDGAIPKKTPFDLVPDSFACPNCKSPKAFFDPIQIEIAGFADNQAYGLGTNTWTEGQKSNAIFGGLALFFFLFLGGYGLN